MRKKYEDMKTSEDIEEKKAAIKPAYNIDPKHAKKAFQVVYKKSKLAVKKSLLSSSVNISIQNIIRLMVEIR